MLGKQSIRSIKSGRRSFFLVLSVSLLVAFNVADAALAQSLSDILQNLTPEQRALAEQYQHGQAPSNPSSPSGAVQSQAAPTTIAEAAANPQSRTSPVEQVLTARAGQTLRLFGYDQVGGGASVTVPATGSVRDDYVLGPGDQIIVVMRGQENSEYTAVIDRNGQLSLPKVGPIPAAGRTLGSFRSDLQTMVHNAFASTTAFVSVGQLRQVSVMVTGEIAAPGTRILTGLSTVLDALQVSGGVNKTGTLRDVRLIRGSTMIHIDLYTLLSARNSSHLPLLQNGDRIFVGPIGATVGIGGYVRRPAAYELPAGQHAISAQALIALANGPSTRGTRMVSLQRTMPDGTQQYLDITRQPERLVLDSEVIVVRTGPDTVVGRVELTGAVRTPGGYPIGKYRTLQDVLPSTEAMVPGAYLLFGYVIRTDHVNLTRGAIPFSPLRVVNKRENLALTSDDVVVVLTRETAQNLLDLATAVPHTARTNEPESAAHSANAQTAGSNPSGAPAIGNPAGAQAIASLLQQAAAAQSGNNQAAPGATAQTLGAVPQGQIPAAPGTTAVPAPAAASGPGTEAAPPSGDYGDMSLAETAFIGHKLRDYQVTFSGALNAPGTYLVAPNTTVAEAISALGGLTGDSDQSSFEITSTKIDNALGTSATVRAIHSANEQELARIILAPFDNVEFRTVYSNRESGAVSISGGVRYPGSFSILRGERLSSVLRRAGGLTEFAYPEGSVFRRSSVAAAEAEESQRSLADMRSQFLTLLTKPTTANAQAPSAETIQALLGLMAQAQNLPAIGRVPVVADLPEIEKHPELDTLLEPGDTLFIPNRPVTVLVMGEVSRPGALRYSGSRSANAYVELAGGTTSQADTSRIIVVLPDGSVRTGGDSWLNFGFNSEVPPGSTIYVPRDLDPLSGQQLIVDVVQIFSQLATTAAALAVLAKQ
jgi:polysaccharide export outer membrane protein